MPHKGDVLLIMHTCNRNNGIFKMPSASAIDRSKDLHLFKRLNAYAFHCVTGGRPSGSRPMHFLNLSPINRPVLEKRELFDKFYVCRFFVSGNAFAHELDQDLLLKPLSVL